MVKSLFFFFFKSFLLLFFPPPPPHLEKGLIFFLSFLSTPPKRKKAWLLIISYILLSLQPIRRSVIQNWSSGRSFFFFRGGIFVCTEWSNIHRFAALASPPPPSTIPPLFVKFYKLSLCHGISFSTRSFHRFFFWGLYDSWWENLVLSRGKKYVCI